MNTPKKIATIAALLVCSSACDNGKSTQRMPPEPPTASQAAPDDASTPTPDEPATQEPAPVELATVPDIDLLDNRYRWHLYRDGLLVPFASEGIRKYTQEYRQPFGKVVEHDGRAGRVLERSAAELRVPWDGDGAATARVWLHGLTNGQRVQLDVNGERADVVSVGNEWTEVLIPIPAGQLRSGENELRLHVRSRGAGGGERSYGLLYGMEIIDGEAPTLGQWPPLTPFTRKLGGEGALAFFGRMSMYVEIPETGHLDVKTEAVKDDASFTARVVTMDGAAQEVLATQHAAGESKTHVVDLTSFAGSLVRLELETDEGAWVDPRIALTKADSRPQPAAYENVILLVVDALRSDRLKLYGETRVDTPRMTAAGERGIVFLNNQAASPSSPPSHGSIQTGMIPRVHGVVGDSAKLDAGTPMISTQLGDAGIATAYYGNNPFGMGRLERPGRWTAFHQPNKEGKGIDCTVLIDEMLGFATQQNKEGKRFFISSLPYEPHTPYRYHEGISDKYHDGDWGPPVGKSVDGYLLGDIAEGSKVLDEDEWSQLKALYDGEVEHMDNCFGQLEDGLKSAGIAEDTAIVLTSDHGEGMFEHGKMGHAFGHYRELADVPLVLYAKGLTDSGPIKMTTVTSHLDIAPTVLDLMGVKPADEIQGRSVVPFALREGPWTPRLMSLEYGRSFGLRAERWKLIVDYGGNEELYDLVEDPTEQKNLLQKNDFALRYMREAAGFFLAHRSEWKTSTWGNLADHDRGFVEHTSK